MFYILKKARLLPVLLMLILLTRCNGIGADPRAGVREVMRPYIDRSYGFSIALPKDFRLSSEQGDLLFFRSLDRPGAVIIRPRPGLSLRTVQTTLRNGFDNETIQMIPSGAPTTLELDGGRGLARDASGSLQGRDVQGMIAGIFGKNDQGYMILIGSVRESWPGFKYTALSILQSFTVMAVEPGFEHERWRQRLEGRRLIYIKGYGTRHAGGAYVGEYHFCSDGTFSQRTDTMYSENYGFSRYSSSTTGKSRGTWRVRIENNNPQLIMDPKRGMHIVVGLDESEGNLLLNDLPYQFAVNELCN